jgi:L,D-transpeptidase ErfK/SrfK
MRLTTTALYHLNKLFFHHLHHGLMMCIGLGSMLAGYNTQALGAVYNPPTSEDNIIGNLQIIQSQTGDSLYKIARRFEMGTYELAKANPRIAPYGTIPTNTGIVIPSFFILPNTSHQGLVINLPEMRVYYYNTEKKEVVTEPIAIGRLGWGTPEISTYVVEKIKDPMWVVPESIQIDSAEKGKTLPEVMPPGPDNPLGQYALRLGNWTILIHGTNQPSSIGQRISSGCIRMYPEDIEYFFNHINEKTPVSIVNQPYKVGWFQGNLYFEAHNTLIETTDLEEEEQRKAYEIIMAAVSNKLSSDGLPMQINWNIVAKALHEHTGIPQRINV